MTNRLILNGLVLLIVLLASCGKPSDYYYKEFLNQAEIAKPGIVDSLEILPGKNRAGISFIVAPDRRINKVRVSYNTSLSSEIVSTFIDIDGNDYGQRKSVILDGLPEATLLVDVMTIDNTGDSSNNISSTGRIYGDRYQRSLYNRILQNITEEDGIKYLNIANESAKPQDSVVFYPLQKTIIDYPDLNGMRKTISISPYVNKVEVADIAASGQILHYSVFKPEENAIDEFSSETVSEDF